MLLPCEETLSHRENLDQISREHSMNHTPHPIHASVQYWDGGSVREGCGWVCPEDIEDKHTGRPNGKTNTLRNDRQEWHRRERERMKERLTVTLKTLQEPNSDSTDPLEDRAWMWKSLKEQSRVMKHPSNPSGSSLVE
ncbi:unnamed protein product [Leuciscus chuanchicus]